MNLLKIERRMNSAEFFINEDAIDSIYEEFNARTKMNIYHVLLRSGVVYDITEKTYRFLLLRDRTNDKS